MHAPAKLSRLWLVIAMSLFADIVTAADLSLPPAVDRSVDFKQHIFPLLKQHCFRCHEGANAESGYRLDLRAELLGETNGQPLIVPGNSAASRLVHLVARADSKNPNKRMPPIDEGEALSAEQIGLLRTWIDRGAAWDDSLFPQQPIRHWAFQPIVRPQIPESTTHRNWVQSPIDPFIAAAYDEQHLAPVKSASRGTLIRRLTLDLTGLPPTYDEVEQFEADTSPDAVERLTDRLLASPRYGERWGRHWLDVARWAESEGFESNHTRPSAWRYRDYVVRAMNHDLPFDLFLRHQLAGDELATDSDDPLIATGFLAAARLSSNEEDRWLQRNDVLVDIVNAISSAVLGLTLRCAQCHNHKFDPLTQRDYYAMQAFFIRGQTNNLALRDPETWSQFRNAAPAGYEAAVRLRDSIFTQTRERVQKEKHQSLSPAEQLALAIPAAKRNSSQQEEARNAELKLILGSGEVERLVAAEDKPLYDELKKKIARLEKDFKHELPQTWGFYSPATAATAVEILPMKGFYPPPYEPARLREAQAYLLVRGNVHQPGPEVAPNWPQVLSFSNSSSPRQRRTDLVDWLVDRQNPLTARVWANRVWHYHFGSGIVKTPDDFGLRGEAPTHPQLLDFLAAELLDHQWSTKQLHHLILSSSVYRLSSEQTETNRQQDPENRYRWRWTPRRLEAEAIRDSLLAASDNLRLTLGGRSEESEAAPRRSVYLLQRREQLPDSLRLFDAPSANESCASREVSTVALQSLYLFNSRFVTEQAKRFAESLLREIEPKIPAANKAKFNAACIQQAFQRTLGRNPTAAEFRDCQDFFESTDTDYQTTLARFCESIFNLNEFAYFQ